MNIIINIIECAQEYTDRRLTHLRTLIAVAVFGKPVCYTLIRIFRLRVCILPMLSVLSFFLILNFKFLTFISVLLSSAILG
jgi:hypothetical protein